MTLARHVDAPEKGHGRHRFTPVGQPEAPRGEDRLQWVTTEWRRSGDEKSSPPGASRSSWEPSRLSG
jgi:hypothetical protein